MTYLIRHAGRIGDMNPKLALRLEQEEGGDIAVYIEDDGVPVGIGTGHQARIEFCSLSNGGGRSKHTRAALLLLMAAMVKDAQESPEAIPPYPASLRKDMFKQS